MFSAHGLDVVVGAENHAGMLAGLGGGFLSLDIWVDEEDCEEATALLADLRERDEGAARGSSDDDDDEYDGDETGASWRAASATIHQRTDARRRTAIALILGCCVTFGTAHMFTGAWLRGVAIAAVELVGIFQAGAGHLVGGVAAVAAVLCDLVGALWRIRARRAALPVARLRRL
jgi:hypothetical protein